MFDALEIVYVEDDLHVRRSVTESFELAGLTVRPFDSAELALRHLTPDHLGVVVTDIRLHGMDGLEFLRKVVALDSKIPVILVTGHGDITMAVNAMREGAYDFLEKPFSTERLIDISRRALEKRSLQIEVLQLRHQLKTKDALSSRLLGESKAMQTLRTQVQNIGNTSTDVLLMGETGTGKELVARCLHDFSDRTSGNFVAINCGGLPESLFESEIFGHEAGAFTGAGKRRVGKFEHAHGGTLLLDEIESMPIALQVKLLRVIQERKIERLGSNIEVPFDCRVIAATKLDLKALSDQGKFRSDLYYRLNVAVLEIPALRDRRDDIPLLFEHFVMQAAVRYSRPVPVLSGDFVRRLISEDWPGNVRELRNIADRTVLGLTYPPQGQESSAQGRPPIGLTQQMDQVEKTLVEQALKQCGGRAQTACDALGIGKKTLYDKINKYGIVLESFRTSES